MAHQQPQSGVGAEPTVHQPMPVQQPMPSHRQDWQAQGVQYAGAAGQHAGAAGQPAGSRAGAAGPAEQTQFEDPLPNPVRWALYDLHKVAQQGRWCAGQCRQEGPEMAEIARTMDDLADLAELNERLIARQSPHGPTMARAFVDAARSASQQLASHPSAHVQGTRRILDRAVDSATRALEVAGATGAGGSVGATGPVGATGTGQSWSLEAPETGLGAPTLPLPP